jgi:hypothetical protein
MVETSDLPLVLCTETTETINLSGSYKLIGGHEVYLKKYRQRAPLEPHLSLHQHVTEMLSTKETRSGKKIIPHYVGASGQPRYPPTKEYAMATLLVHKPWSAEAPPSRTDEEMVSEFMEFVESPDCPKQVQMEYSRVKERYLSKRPPEAVASEECYDREIQPDMDAETKDILSIVTNVTHSTDPFLSVNEFSFDRGLNYDWSHRTFPVRGGQMRTCCLICLVSRTISSTEYLISCLPLRAPNHHRNEMLNARIAFGSRPRSQKIGLLRRLAKMLLIVNGSNK